MHIVIDARIRQSSTGRYVDGLLDHLQRIDFTNSYSVLINPDDAWRPVTENFVAVPCPFAQFSLNLLEQIRFSRQLRGLRPDLVHFAMPQQPLLYFGKTVTTVHDLTILRFPRSKTGEGIVYWLKDLTYKVMLRYWLLKTQSVIVPSKYVRKDLAKFQSATKKKITVTYEASEEPTNDKILKPKFARKPFIFHAGSPLPHKNIGSLIDAFEKLIQEKPGLQLILVGKKEYYFKQLQKKIDGSPAREQIVTPGFVVEGELKWLYKNAEAYVLPSLSEGFGLPGIEAMSYGTPVVSSNTTCLPEIYGDAALYFNPNNVDDIAVKIERIVKDTQFREELIAKGFKQATKYSWTKMAEQTLEVYKKVLGI